MQPTLDARSIEDVFSASGTQEMQKRILAFLLIVPTMAFAQTQKAPEQQEVTKIFDAIIPKMDVRAGDGLGSNFNCVFARKWDPSFHRDKDGEPNEQFDPHEKLTIQQAIDPMAEHADMFCNYSERDAQAQQTAEDTGNTNPH